MAVERFVDLRVVGTDEDGGMKRSSVDWTLVVVTVSRAYNLLQVWCLWCVTIARTVL